MCEDSQYGHDLGADWVNYHGELIIAGDWLTESGINDAEEQEIAAAPGVIWLRRREEEILEA